MLVIGLTLNMASIVYPHQLLVSTSQCICTCLGVHWIYTLFSSSTFKQLLSFCCKLSCRQLLLKDTDLALSCCTFLSHVPRWIVILLLLEAHAFLVCGRLLALCINLVIHTLIRSIFQRLSVLNTSDLLELKSSNDSLWIHGEPYKRVNCSQTQTTEGLDYCCRYLLTSLGCKISVDAGNVSAFWSRFQTRKYGFLGRGLHADLLAPDKQLY